MYSQQPVPAARNRGIGSPGGGTKPSFLKKNKPIVVSDEDDDDSLSDEDLDLLANFNATQSSKDRKVNDMHGVSPKSSPQAARRPRGDDFMSHDGNPLMMTIRKPFQPTSKRPSSPAIQKGRGLNTLDESDASSEDELTSSPATKPSFLRGVQQRPTSPNVHGRSKDSFIDSLLNDKPKPSPRQRHQQEKVSKNDSETLFGRQDSGESFGHKTPSSRKTPVDDRKSPIANRSSPGVEVKSFESGRSDKTQKDSGDSRKSPFSDGRKTPVDDKFVSRKSPHEADLSRKSSRQGTPAEERKSPALTSKIQNKDEKPNIQKRGSVLDFLTGAGDEKHSSDEDETYKEQQRWKSAPRQHEQKSTSSRPSSALRRQKSQEPSNPFDKDHKSPVSEQKSNRIHKANSTTSDKGSRPQSKTKVQSHSDKEEQSDSDGSICEEFIEEPAEQDASDQDETTTSQNKPKQQRSGQQKSDETIELVREVQAEASKMRFIEPAKSDTKKDSRPPSRVKMPVEVHKPKPRYEKPAVTSPASSTSSLTNFDSTDKIRDVIFNEWLAKRAVNAKKQMTEKQKKEKEEEERRAKSRQEKLENGKMAFKTWSEAKKDYLSEKQMKKKKEEDTAKMEEEKRKKKKEEAEMNFVKWKESIDEKLKREKRREEQKKLKLEAEKEENKRMKQEAASSAYTSWKSNKDELITTRVKEEKHKSKEEKEKERKERERHEEEAKRLYDEWIEKKEDSLSDVRDTAYRKLMESRQAWTPAGGRTIPVGK